MSQVFMLVCVALLLVSASVRQAVCLTQPLRRLSRNNCQRRIVGIEAEHTLCLRFRRSYRAQLWVRVPICVSCLHKRTLRCISVAIP